MSMTEAKILYAGDSWEGGPANYLLGILKSLGVPFLHVPAAVQMSTKLLENPYQAVILSDYACSLVSEECQQQILKQVAGGAGLLMIGGWASFSGPYGGWRRSAVESILPVICAEEDDRMNISGGALMHVKTPHPMFDSLSFLDSPVLCGLNRLQAKKDSTTVLVAKKIAQSRGNDREDFTLKEENEELPLFIVDGNPAKRVGALATDVAPHWCGGLVDWGERHEKLQINPKMAVEVGNRYVRFVSLMLQWLIGGRNNG